MFGIRSGWSYLSLVLSMLAIIGCADSLSTGDATLPDGATDDIGATARDEVEAAISAFTLPSSISPVGTTQAAPAPPAAGDFAPPCVNPSQPGDSDGDGVPADARYNL